MSKLDELRGQINQIDAEMRALFTRRMGVSGEVARFKQAEGLPVLDAERERQVITQNVAQLENEALAPYYTAYLENLMSLSRGLQAEILAENVVAYQGAKGGFQHQVFKRLFPHAKGLYRPTFAAVFEAVESGEAAYGVVPFENSNTGDVAGVLDLLYNHRVYITEMYDLPVKQNLLALPGAKLSDIKEIYSHQQALEQCRRFIEGLGAQPVPYDNTATAAKFVAEKGNSSLAAIASLEAAGRYGLVPLAEDIATEASNTTRFIIIAKRPANSGDRFSLLVTIENSVGALEKVITAISAEGLNMEAIKSRPMPHRPWEYYFYIEMVGAPSADETSQLLGRIGKVCVSARMLGLYKRVSEP